MKSKTLKSIMNITEKMEGPIQCCRDCKIDEFYWKLREEAIKEIKWFELHANVEHILKTETKSSPISYFVVNEPDKLLKHDTNSAIRLANTRLAIRDYIKYKFNITAKEVK